MQPAPADSYRGAMLGKAHLYRDETREANHIDDLAPRLEALGFTEVLETGDKFAGTTPNRYTDQLRVRQLLELFPRRQFRGQGLRPAAGTPVFGSADQRDLGRTDCERSLPLFRELRV